MLHKSPYVVQWRIQVVNLQLYNVFEDVCVFVVCSDFYGLDVVVTFEIDPELLAPFFFNA